jgi:phage gpG-like protein
VADPITGRTSTRGNGEVRMEFRPPIEFIQRQIGGFRHELEDLDGLWDRFSRVLPDIFRSWFSSHGDGTWPPLAPSTIAEKSKQGYPPDPLVRTGTMRAHLLDPNYAVERSHDSFAWGTDDPYAAFHQTGTTRMPMRQVIPDPFPVRDRQLLESAVVDWVNDAAARMAHGEIAA